MILSGLEGGDLSELVVLIPELELRSSYLVDEAVLDEIKRH